jgi:pimeloyl-ACP methyl ester carboxylesterase
MKTMRIPVVCARVGLAALLLVVACKSKAKSEDEKTAKTTEPAKQAPEDKAAPAEAPVPPDAKTLPAKPPPAEPTTKVKVGDSELDVWVRGEGAPVIFIHGVMFRDPFGPLLDKLEAKGGLQLITYGRRGYGGKKTGPIDIPGQAKDVVAVLDHLKIKKANIVGHSYGAAIALQVGIQSPDRAQSLVLLEPPLPEFAPSFKKMGEGMAPIVEKYKKGDKEGALTDFLAANGGSKEVVDKELPGGAWELALGDIDTLFQVELPALGTWKVKPDAVKKLKMPVLFMKGADTLPIFAESGDAIHKWLPKAQQIAVPSSNHFFPVTQSDACATGMAQFVAEKK